MAIRVLKKLAFLTVVNAKNGKPIGKINRVIAVPQPVPYIGKRRTEGYFHLRFLPVFYAF